MFHARKIFDLRTAHGLVASASLRHYVPRFFAILYPCAACRTLLRPAPSYRRFFRPNHRLPIARRTQPDGVALCAYAARDPDRCALRRRQKGADEAYSGRARGEPALHAAVLE